MLALCAGWGWAVGTVALDGMKIAASASKAANRAEGGLGRLAGEAVAAHAAADPAEDELFGTGPRRDEVRRRRGRPRGRDERIAAALAELEAGRKAAEEEQAGKAEEFRARRAAGRRTGWRRTRRRGTGAGEPSPGVGPARPRWRARHAPRWLAGRCGAPRPAPATTAGSGRPPRRWTRRGRGQPRRTAGRGAEREPQGPGPVRNITDPDSRLMPVRGGGFIQGYNAQNVTSEDGLVIATELTDDPADMAWFGPMMAGPPGAAALIGANRPAGPRPGTGGARTAAQGGHRAWRSPTPGTAPRTT